MGENVIKSRKDNLIHAIGDSSVRPYFEHVSVEVAAKTSENGERIQQLKEKVKARCPVYTLLKAAGVQMNDQWYEA
jgi:uncharacterized OsmC-like protein